MNLKRLGFLRSLSLSIGSVFAQGTQLFDSFRLGVEQGIGKDLILNQL